MKLFITIERLSKAVQTVQRELYKMGFWSDEMAETEIYLIPAHHWHGYVNMSDGHIRIPVLSLSNIAEKLLVGKSGSLLDLVRHEYGHVFTYHHFDRVNTKRFEKAFGCSWVDDGAQTFDEDRHVTRYAATDIYEDFAEVFRFFLKHKGRMPARWKERSGIAKRWKYLAGLGS